MVSVGANARYHSNVIILGEQLRWSLEDVARLISRHHRQARFSRAALSVLIMRPQRCGWAGAELREITAQQRDLFDRRRYYYAVVFAATTLFAANAQV